jgi:hypothetical protein
MCQGAHGGGGVRFGIVKKCYLFKDLLGKPRNDKWQFVTIVNIRRGYTSDARHAQFRDY